MAGELTVVCHCKRQMENVQSGVLAIEFKDKELTEPYKYWRADLLQCPSCGRQVVSRFASKPIALEHEKEKIEALRFEPHWDFY